jgi:hypothetical protein
LIAGVTGLGCDVDGGRRIRICEFAIRH